MTTSQVILILAVVCSVLIPVVTVMVAIGSEKRVGWTLTLALWPLTLAVFGVSQGFDLVNGTMLFIAAVLLGLALLFHAEPFKFGRGMAWLATLATLAAGIWAIFV